MFKMFLTTLVLTVFALGDSPVLKTGQVKSYDTAGNEVTDGSIKDDGYYRAGAVRSYSRGVQVVTDNTTGLIWTDGTSAKRRWDDLWPDNAAGYCYYKFPQIFKWRLPNIKELETLVDYGRYDPAVTEDVFQHISSYYYWSSTTAAGNSSNAWFVDFYYGYSYYGDKDDDYYVRCVRGGELEPANLSRSGEIVTDSTTGLQWQDDDIVKTAERTWQEAIDYCENDVTLGGHNDWRLPNEKEMLSIRDKSHYNPAMDTGSSGFQNFSSDYYWSSTTNAYYTSNAWVVNFNNGRSNYSNKTNNHYVRCVRGGQFDTSSFLPPVIMYLLD